jgi:hypothetical protein
MAGNARAVRPRDDDGAAVDASVRQRRDGSRRGQNSHLSGTRWKAAWPLNACTSGGNKPKPGAQRRLRSLMWSISGDAMPAAWAAMPKAAVHEEAQPARRKHQVWPAGKIVPIQPIAQASSVQRAAHQKLGHGMLAPDARHVSTSAVGTDAVHGRRRAVFSREWCPHWGKR